MLTRISEWLGGIPIPAVVALLVLLVVQLSLQIYGLIDLAKRPAVPGGRKWVWALVIVGGNLVGAIVYLGFGRSAPAPAAAEGAAGADARDRALDRLYGDRKGS